jgi:hypothetical protein
MVVLVTTPQVPYLEQRLVSGPQGAVGRGITTAPAFWEKKEAMDPRSLVKVVASAMAAYSNLRAAMVELASVAEMQVPSLFKTGVAAGQEQTPLTGAFPLAQTLH